MNSKKIKGADSTGTKIILVAVNIIIIIFVTVMSINYFANLSQARNKNAKRIFASTISTVGQVAYGYLKSTQTFCNNWASYVTQNEMDIDEAMDFLTRINSDPDIMSHVIHLDTLEGLSTVSRTDDPNDFSVSYKGNSDFIDSLINEIENCDIVGIHPHITQSYINPINGDTVVGFCKTLMITNDNGEKEKAMLICVLPVSVLEEQWVFPTAYDKAELAITDINGKYIVRPKSMDNTNFFDFIHDCNKEQYPDAGMLRDEFSKNGAATIECLNAEGQASFYSYHRGLFKSDWIIIGYIAESDMNVVPVNLTIAFIVIIGFLVLILCDGSYIIKVNKRLKISMQETKNANEAKTRFLSSMSHDIRTPMNAIVGMTAIAQKHIEDKEQVEDYLQKIDLASNHLLTLINDILDMSKVESGKFTMNPVVFSLAESATNLVNIAHPQIKSKNMDFDVRVSGIDKEYIYSDELRINQIFINLLSNAIKYTPEGGRVVLTLEQKPSEKDPKNVQLIYTVSDNGIGMSEEFMKEMYHSFSRESGKAANSVQGTGLGLAITKQMVDLLGGTIDVKSKLGEGTTFKVTLDLPTAEKTTDGLKMPPVRVLIVDDDNVCLENAADTLRSLGAQPDTANNGKEAVEMILKNHDEGTGYPCIVMDWKMPEMDGLEATKKIRENIGSEVPIIIISSYDWTEIEEQAKEAGVNGFINKPLFRSTLYNKMNELLKFDDSQTPVDDDNGEDLQGINLLIAEDNDINWEIIHTLLEMSNITSERAENGKLCVERITAAEKGEFDAILMDVQMPVMNGRDATRAIRKSEDEYVKNIPIIAMTADAFTEDIISCKEAGMNGHASKPIDMKKLFKELRKVIQK